MYRLWQIGLYLGRGLVDEMLHHLCHFFYEYYLGIVVPVSVVILPLLVALRKGPVEVVKMMQSSLSLEYCTATFVVVLVAEVADYSH